MKKAKVALAECEGNLFVSYTPDGAGKERMLQLV